MAPKIYRGLKIVPKPEISSFGRANSKLQFRNSKQTPIIQIPNYSFLFYYWDLKFVICFGFEVLGFRIFSPRGRGGRGAFHVSESNSALQWSRGVNHGGAHGSENAGMSSVLDPWESGPPKAQGFRREVRPRRVSRLLRRGRKGVVDGQQVKIPVLVLERY